MQTTVARELESGTKGSEILPWAEARFIEDEQKFWLPLAKKYAT